MPANINIDDFQATLTSENLPIHRFNRVIDNDAYDINPSPNARIRTIDKILSNENEPLIEQRNEEYPEDRIMGVAVARILNQIQAQQTNQEGTGTTETNPETYYLIGGKEVKANLTTDRDGFKHIEFQFVDDPKEKLLLYYRFDKVDPPYITDEGEVVTYDVDVGGAVLQKGRRTKELEAWSAVNAITKYTGLTLKDHHEHETPELTEEQMDELWKRRLLVREQILKLTDEIKAKGKPTNTLDKLNLGTQKAHLQRLTEKYTELGKTIVRSDRPKRERAAQAAAEAQRIRDEEARLQAEADAKAAAEKRRADARQSKIDSLNQQQVEEAKKRDARRSTQNRSSASVADVMAEHRAQQEAGEKQKTGKHENDENQTNTETTEKTTNQKEEQDINDEVYPELEALKENIEKLESTLRDRLVELRATDDKSAREYATIIIDGRKFITNTKEFESLEGYQDALITLQTELDGKQKILEAVSIATENVTMHIEDSDPQIKIHLEAINESSQKIINGDLGVLSKFYYHLRMIRMLSNAHEQQRKQEKAKTALMSLRTDPNKPNKQPSPADLRKDTTMKDYLTSLIPEKSESKRLTVSDKNPTSPSQPMPEWRKNLTSTKWPSQNHPETTTHQGLPTWWAKNQQPQP